MCGDISLACDIDCRSMVSPYGGGAGGARGLIRKAHECLITQLLIIIKLNKINNNN